MIWTYIFDFLVMYVFGGVASNNQQYRGYILTTMNVDSSNFSYEIFDVTMPLGNYLSLITTIIIMALIVWFVIWLTIWVFKLVSHAFLLK